MFRCAPRSTHAFPNYSSTSFVRTLRNPITTIRLRHTMAETQQSVPIPSIKIPSGIPLRTLDSLTFDNTAIKQLPLDKRGDKIVRRSIPGIFYSRATPTPITKPELVTASPDALVNCLDLDPKEIFLPEFVEYFSGNKLLKGSEPVAHCYCGHQFGSFAGQLGDGRAISLGEVVNHKGERWELQLKGAGLTPYSRDADGRAVLRSSIREFLCSEAMYFLGVPTTRAGSCITSDTLVIRDLRYTGNPIKEKATVVLRLSPTFIRFGSFEIFKPSDTHTGRAGPSVGLHEELLPKLLNYTIENHFPELWKDEKLSADIQEMYLRFFEEVVRRTAFTVTQWQCIGWVHGVLNTDNLSILGVTIDYGPFGFMDHFDPAFISNGSDHSGRYSYENQPAVCKWNCERLADALSHILPDDALRKISGKFSEYYEQYYYEKMFKKLGFLKSRDQGRDRKMVDSLLDVMQQTGSDWTNTFRCLSRIPIPQAGDAGDKAVESVLDYLMTIQLPLRRMLKTTKPQVPAQQLAMMIQMAKTNPMFLAAMGVDEDFLEAEMRKVEKYNKAQLTFTLLILKEVTQEEKQEENRKIWADWLASYRQRLVEEVDESTSAEAANQQRVQVMNSNNPKFVLRNYIAQNAIKAAEEGSYEEVNRLLELFYTPYSEHEEFAEFGYDRIPPEWSDDLCVTCSS